MANLSQQKSHSQWKLTLKTTFQAKHTSKNADHLEAAAEAADEDLAEAAEDTAADAIGVAAEDTAAVAAVTVADAIEATDAVAAAAAAVTDQDTKLPTLKLEENIFLFLLFALMIFPLLR
jgi:hypothetical protein